MPTKTDTRTEQDSTFYNSPPSERLRLEEMDRLRATVLYNSSERIRTDSEDSGIGGMAAPATDINLSMKKVSRVILMLCLQA